MASKADEGASTPLLGTVEEGGAQERASGEKSAFSAPWRASVLSLGLIFALVGVVNLGTVTFFGKGPAADLIAADRTASATSAG